MHMVLAMSRPSRHPKTGIFWVRKRVPSDLVARVGRSVEYFSLRMHEPIEAKQRHAEAMARLEARWAELRRGESVDAPSATVNTNPAGRSLSEREAAARAVDVRPLAQRASTEPEPATLLAKGPLSSFMAASTWAHRT